MKKVLLLTLTILFGAIIAFAQNLSLVHNGSPIEANSVILFEGIANNDEMVIELEVTNNSNASIDVMVKKVENFVIPTTVNTFCWAGLCYPPFIFISPNFTTIPAGGTSAVGDFSGHYNPMSIAGLSTISYVFFDNDNHNDSVMVTINYSALTTGINPNAGEKLVISEPYPNPANQLVNFDYELNDADGAQLSVYSLIGSLVKEIKISNESGTLQLSTDQFQEGFYFYVLSTSGKELKAGRFIVSH
jgi:hypothetical protein